MIKLFILLLGLTLVISGCVQQPTGQVASRLPESTQQPIEKPTYQPIQTPSEPTTQSKQPEVTKLPAPIPQPQAQAQQAEIQNVSCEGTAGCYYGNVTRIIDGDTMEVDGIRIRLALVDAPEPSFVGGFEATNFIHQNCPVGSKVVLDQDDLQLYDNYDRMLAVVWCQEKRINEEIIAQGYADISYQFCPKSEFGDDDWSVRLGCTKQTTPPTTDKPSCDPAYPDVCIPSPPPDLDCGEIEYRMFQVLQPDPHRFDGDKDGIGCESEPSPPSAQPTSSISAESHSGGASCDPAYPTVCIPSPPPDLDCGEISYKRFKVLSPDPHRFDGDKDGIGCER